MITFIISNIIPTVGGTEGLTITSITCQWSLYIEDTQLTDCPLNSKGKRGQNGVVYECIPVTQRQAGQTAISLVGFKSACPLSIICPLYYWTVKCCFSTIFLRNVVARCVGTRILTHIIHKRKGLQYYGYKFVKKCIVKSDQMSQYVI